MSSNLVARFRKVGERQAPGLGQVRRGHGPRPGRGTLEVEILEGRYLPSVVGADFNRDGLVDLATNDVLAGHVVVVLRNSDGSFQVAGAFPVGANSVSLASADVNGDDFADLVTADFSGGAVSQLLGNGDGSFQAVAADVPLGVESTDVNGDGYADLTIFDQRTSIGMFLLGTSDGSFQTLSATVVNSGGGSLIQTSTVDFGVAPGPLAVTTFPDGTPPWQLLVNQATNAAVVDVNFFRSDLSSVVQGNSDLRTTSTLGQDVVIDGNAGSSLQLVALQSEPLVILDSVSEASDFPFVAVPLLVAVSPGSSPTVRPSATVSFAGLVPVAASAPAEQAQALAASAATLTLSSGSAAGMGQSASPAASQAVSEAAASGGDAVTRERIDAAINVLTLTDEQALANRDDLLSGVDLAGALLTGTRAIANLLPQKGTSIAPVATVFPADEVPAADEAATDEEIGWGTVVVGLDDTVHRKGPSRPTDVRPANAAQAAPPRENDPAAEATRQSAAPAVPRLLLPFAALLFLAGTCRAVWPGRSREGSLPTLRSARHRPPSGRRRRPA